MEQKNVKGICREMEQQVLSASGPRALERTTNDEENTFTQNGKGWISVTRANFCHALTGEKWSSNKE